MISLKNRTNINIWVNQVFDPSFTLKIFCSRPCGGSFEKMCHCIEFSLQTENIKTFLPLFSYYWLFVPPIMSNFDSLILFNLGLPPPKSLFLSLDNLVFGLLLHKGNRLFLTSHLGNLILLGWFPHLTQVQVISSSSSSSPPPPQSLSSTPPLMSTFHPETLSLSITTTFNPCHNLY